MTFSLRSVALIVAGLTALMVAPAQAFESPEPLILGSSTALPSQTVLQPISASYKVPEAATIADPLSPQPSDDAVDQSSVIVPKLSGDLSAKVASLRSSDTGSREIECLAVAVYYEAKSEPLAGQLAVGQVIANRVQSGRFASSYCGVLFQRSQFSFVRGKSYPAPARASRQWQNAVAVARIVDQKLHLSSVPRALFFHAKRVSPGWRLSRLGSVGNHVFYR